MKTKILEIIYQAIDDVNFQNDLAIKKEPETKLFGSQGTIDSLGLVNLIVSVEEGVNTEFETSITLADEKAMSQKNSPFKSIQSLADYIYELLNN
jgi:acyl carrier protein